MNTDIRRQVCIKENSWLAKQVARVLGFTYVAMVCGHTIHLYNTTKAQFFARPSWVAHELKHVEQYEQHGFLRFVCKYIFEHWRNGYHNNRFEIEARAAERNLASMEAYNLDHYIRK